MISRRELLRRAGLAGLVATPLVALAKIAPKKGTELLLDDKPIKPVTSLKRPINLNGSEVSINGEIVGQIESIEMQEQRRTTIDITRLDSNIRPHFLPDYGEIKVTSLDSGDGLLIMQDALNNAECVTVAMMMGGMEYKFEAHIAEFAISSSYNDVIRHETTMLVVGEIQIT